MGQDDEMDALLLRWATEQDLLGDPDVVPKLYDEARRRWGHLTARYYLGEIVSATLKKMQEKEEMKGA